MTYAKFIGVDVAKDKLDVVALMVDKKPLHKVFKNNETGFKALLEWLKKHTQDPCVCMEATGHYSEAVAEFLYQHDVFVSVVNPYQIKQFARMKLARNKNDKADATLIAEYAQQTALTAFKPRSKEQKRLRDLMLLQNTLKEQKVQLTNKATSIQSSETKNEIKKILKQINKQIDGLQAKMTELVKTHEQFKKIADRLIKIMGF
jgi:transposase